MEFQKAVANNIKQMRESRKLTLDAAAKLTGVSRSMLSQIEKGDVNPTISVLWKIANGYKTSFSSLISPEAGAHLLIWAEDVTALPEDEGRYINRPAFPFQDDAQFETYMIEIKPGGFLQAQAHLGGAVEFVTLFSGEAEICAGGDVFRLRRGDSLRFRADVEHTYRNTGTETVHINMIIYYSKV